MVGKSYLQSPKVLFFDFDGTLADSLSVALTVIRELSPSLGLPVLEREDLMAWKSKSMKELMQITGVSPLQIPRILSEGRNAYKKHIQSVTLFEGVRELLLELKSQNFDLHILTSNTASTVQQVLHKHDAEVFTAIHAPDLLFGKARVLKNFQKKHKISPQNMAMIGDEVRDVEAGKAAGVHAFAVSWGFNHADLLQKAAPDVLAHSLPELHQAIVDCFIDKIQ